MTDSLSHIPQGPWAFDEQVTDCFEDMLRRSIPQYDVMRESVEKLMHRHRFPRSHILDLGCSRGDAIARAVERYGQEQGYYGCDVSEPMLQTAKARFAGNPNVCIEHVDLRTGFPDVGAACVTLAILTLQFIPINYRQAIVQRVYDVTQKGGAFIVVEKVLGAGAGIEQSMVEIYHEQKVLNGYTADSVERKRLSLEGVLVPVTAEWNEQLLRRVGFNEVDCFWRWMNFAGWIAIKR